MVFSRIVGWSASSKRMKEGIGITVDSAAPVAPKVGDLWFDDSNTDMFFAHGDAACDSNGSFALTPFTVGADVDMSALANVVSVTLNYTNNSGMEQTYMVGATYAVNAILDSTQTWGVKQRVVVNGVTLVEDGYGLNSGLTGKKCEKGAYVYPGGVIAAGASIAVITKMFYNVPVGTAVGGTGITSVYGKVRIWGGPS